MNSYFLSAATLHHDHLNYLLPFFPSPFFGPVFFAATFTRRSSSFTTADFAAAMVSRFTSSVFRPSVKRSTSIYQSFRANCEIILLPFVPSDYPSAPSKRPPPTKTPP